MTNIPTREKKVRGKISPIESTAKACERLAVQDGPLICAYSGGADSRFLLSALLNSNLSSRVVVVHVDHAMDDGSADRAFDGARVCSEAGVEYVCLHAGAEISELMAAGDSPEEAARKARYSLFAKHYPGASVFVAHHADDQAETVLFRLGRGTGTAGAAGMREISRREGLTILRPMLTLRSRQIRETLSDAGIPWLEDPTNADVSAATRNFIRLELIPMAETRIPGFSTNISRAASIFAESSDLADDVALSDLKSASLETGGYDVHKLRSLSPVRLRNLFSRLPALLDLHPSPTEAQVREAAEYVFSNASPTSMMRLGGVKLTLRSGGVLGAESVKPLPPRKSLGF